MQSTARARTARSLTPGCYTKAEDPMKNFAVTFFLVVLSAVVIGGCSSSTEPEQPKITVVLSSDVSGGEAPFDVNFVLEIVGSVEGKRTHVPAYHFNSGQGRIADTIEYSLPDTSITAMRSYSWTTGYTGNPGVRLAVAYLKLLDGRVYSDTLRIEVE